MVTVQDNSCIFIKVLLLDPADELVYLSAGTCEGVGVSVSLEILTAQFALISVFKVGINRQHGKVEGLLRVLCKLQKGIDIAIRAAELLKKRGIPFKWYVIGDGRERMKLSMMIRAKGLSDSFILLGIRQNPYPYLKACDLFALTSRFEGYPVTLIEARALCVPILAPDMPCIREQITDGLNGMLTEADPVKIADRINEFRKDPSMGSKMREHMAGETIDFSADYSKIEALIGK